VWLVARSNYGRFDDRVAAKCMTGCLEDNPDYLAAKSFRESGDTEQRVAFAAFGVGGAVVLTGVLLIYLNQPRIESVPMLAPSVGPDHASVSLTGSW
jgi:hypothetical protein